MLRYGSLKRLRHDERGSPALEFAVIAPLFFLTLFSVFEVGRALYERNRVASAAAIAMREIAKDNNSSYSQLETAIKKKLHNLDVNKLSIAVCNKSIQNQVFKEISITYKHDLLIHLGSHFTGFSLTATRFAPAARGSTSGSTCA